MILKILMFICVELCLAACFMLPPLALAYLPNQSLNNNAVLFYDLGLEGGWIPYQRGANAGSAGVFEEVITAISSHSNVVFKAVYFPPKRAEMALKSGLVDFDFVCLEWFTNGIDESKYVISEPIFEISEMFVTRKNTDVKLNSAESYFGLDIGTIAGYFYLNDNKFNRVDFLNEQQVMLGLKEDRFKVAILEREVAKHWAGVHALDIQFPLIHTQGYLRLRLRIEHQDKLEAINNAIIQVRNNGKLQQILTKHKLSAKLP